MRPMVSSICIVLLFAAVAFAARTVVITGANRGIGFATVQKLLLCNQQARDSGNANACWDIVMACRSPAKAEAALKKLGGSTADNIRVEELDLASFASIESFASRWGKMPIDCLALNAGIQPNKYETTVEGFESTVGTNHIGHFYLMNLLLPMVERSKAGRVAWVGSGVHNPDEAGGNVGSKATLGPLAGFERGFVGPDCAMVDGAEAYDGDKAYKDSKLCNVMTSLELAKRLKARRSRVTSNVMNPGLIPTTGLFRAFSPLFVIPFTFLTRTVFKVAATEEEGGARLCELIQGPSLAGVSGQYLSTARAGLGLSDFLPIAPSGEARDEEKAKRFWQLTEKLIKERNPKFKAF